MTPALIIVLLCGCGFIWASGYLIGYAVGQGQAREHTQWLCRKIGELAAANLRLQQHIDSWHDPADYWKGEDNEPTSPS